MLQSGVNENAHAFALKMALSISLAVINVKKYSLYKC